MDLLSLLAQLAGGGRQQPRPDGRPFKMYEDRSFQGDPRQYMQNNPGHTFYEDGSFSEPQPFKMYEDQSFQGDPRQAALARPSTRFYEDNSFSPPQPLQGAGGSLSVQPTVDRRNIQVAPSGGLQGTSSGSLLNQLSVRRPRR